MTRTKEECEKACKKGKVFWACAHCIKYWAGVDLQLGRCAGRDCGSPFIGKAFEEYDGPMLDWAACFVCGGQAKHEIFAPGCRPLGICQEHLQFLESLRAGKIEAHQAEEAQKPI